MKKIILTEMPKLEKPDLKKIVADAMVTEDAKKCKGDCCSQDQVYQIASSLFTQLEAVYSACMQRISNVVSEINSLSEEHANGHLPPLDRTQKLAVLDAAGIADQFEVELPELDLEAGCIWASKKGEKSIANAIKIEVK